MAIPRNAIFYDLGPKKSQNDTSKVLQNTLAVTGHNMQKDSTKYH